MQKPSDQRELHLLGGGWRVGCEKGRAMELEINRSQLVKGLECHSREGRLGLGLGVNDAQTCQILNVAERKSLFGKKISNLKAPLAHPLRVKGRTLPPQESFPTSNSPSPFCPSCMFLPSLNADRGWAVP